METKIERIGGKNKVTFGHGGQRFVIDFEGTKKECEWLRQQLINCFENNATVNINKAIGHLKQHEIDVFSRTDKPYLEALHIASGQLQ